MYISQSKTLSIEIKLDWLDSPMFLSENSIHSPMVCTCLLHWEMPTYGVGVQSNGLRYVYIWCECPRFYWLEICLHLLCVSQLLLACNMSTFGVNAPDSTGLRYVYIWCWCPSFYWPVTCLYMVWCPSFLWIEACLH